ncbi:MAG: DUF4097 domain-containing protein [Gemmatimonadetes bacterium]|nr:DUF4097 domain-containing protein [Gemmatimonadota bacterium]
MRTHLPPSGSRTARAALAALSALLIAWPVAGQTVVERTVPFARDGAFRVMVMEGTVRARAWDRDSVRVVARVTAEGRRGFYMGVSRKGDGGKMGIEDGGPAHVEVFLPRGASVWVKTSEGAIDVAGIEGSVDAFSVTGAIRLAGSPRSLHAESMGGGVRLEGEPRVARIRTGAGDIDVNGGGPDLTLSSVNGGIVVSTTAPLRRALVETVGGSVSVRTALSAGSTLVINSHDGPVEVALPAGTDVDFLMSTLEGGLRNLLTGRDARKATGLRGRELSFTSGFGGAEVTVRTFSGSVTVRPLDRD